MTSVLKVCPDRLELSQKLSYHCPELECNGLQFQSTSNLNLHLEKYHKIQVKRENFIREFYCPDQGCTYHIDSKGAHFKSKKYLKQHFQKVHATKIYECQSCDKKFATLVFLENHRKNCGEFKCAQCGRIYNSRETYKTHIRRKRHIDTTAEGKNTPEKKKVKSKKSKSEDKAVQTAQHSDKSEMKCTKIIESSNSELPESNGKSIIDKFSQTIDNFNVNYLDDSLISIETQTDIVLDKLLTCSGADNSNSEPTKMENQIDNLDSMIYSNDMYTQTCDEILRDLGLTNSLHTQTPFWDEMTSPDFNDLFVSTETQTSFSECLLANSMQTQTNNFNSTQTQTW